MRPDWRPTIAVIEDAHWADEATLDLVRFIGRRIQGTRALLILTFRDDELSPRHPLRAVLGDLASSPAARRIPLAPLSENAVQALIGQQPLDAARVHQQTGGNPFFVAEVLSSDAGGLPATVRDVILARAASLSPSAQAVLEAAAVIGPRIEPWLLAELTGAEAVAADDLRQRLRAGGALRLPPKPRSSTRENPFGLTLRQVEILGLLVEGASNPDIAARLHLSPKTVEHHVAAILAQLDVHTREAAAAQGRRHPHFSAK